MAADWTLPKSYRAGEAITYGRALYIDGSDGEEVKILANGTGSAFIGISAEGVANAEPVQVIVEGKAIAVISGTVETGDLLTPTTGGALIKRTDGSRPVAIYLGRPGADFAAQDLTTGQEGEVYVINPGVVNGAPLVLSFDVTVDPAERAANTTADLSLTVPGALTTDEVVNVFAASLESGLVLSNARVSAADTVIVRLGNVTVGAINAAEQTFTVVLARHYSA
jgi:hypothetical protein